MGLATLHKDWLTERFGRRVCFDARMDAYSTFKVGGRADALVAPAHLEELVDLITWSESNRIPRLVLGGGSNLLVKDDGFRGIVLAMTKAIGTISVHDATRPHEILVDAMAGANLQALCRFAIEQGFSGMNFAVGIPGTVGGAVVMNAGTADGCMGDVVAMVTAVLPDGSIDKIPRDCLDFDYRGMRWPDAYGNHSSAVAPIVVNVRLRLKKGQPEALAIAAEKLRMDRLAKQPTHLPSAGCFFKNPPGHPPAGKLIDAAGLKGAAIGGAVVSSKHANYIVNKGDATASDIIALMEKIQASVYKKFSVHLEPEVKIVG